jgi:putative transposase
MPRHARLDAPHTLHHVMVRGLERRAIFRDDADRGDFSGRLAALAEAGALTVLAWACLPNHAHLLVRTGTRPLAPILGVRPQAVYQAARRGREARAEWERLVGS